MPEDFAIHKRLARQVKAKVAMFEPAGREDSVADGAGVDWAAGEALAFGALMLEGYGIRFTGQDVQRGTFSHRHAVATDQKTGRQHTFLNAIAPAAGDPEPASKLYIENSPLSEYAVLGYELGYSMENPDQLVVWEAQFGDFVNGAQIIIDQFISSGEAKWMRQSGLVMLLPHGYQGQGPEHSSCRIERFLQSSDEDPDTIPPDLDTPAGRLRQVQRINWQVVNVSTPANYYHVLRRQLHREFRKPLIVAGTKALLRDELAVSPLADFGPGSAFKRVIGEIEPAALKPADGVRRVVMCSGKVYYELLKERRAQGIDDVAIVRLEQFTPFPFQDVAAEARTYPNAEIVWCQEEPKNAGGWLYVRDRILTATRKMNGEVRRPAYVGRRTMASPAEGYGNVHTREQNKIISTALGTEVSSFPFGYTEFNPIGKAA